MTPNRDIAERALDLAEALARTLEERVENRPTRRVGERPEHDLVAGNGHRLTDR